MRAAITDLLFELNKATSVRPTYEESTELPLKDLFFVGGQLQRLIRRSEEALASFSLNLPGNTRSTIHSRLDEVRAFRNYIVKRIKQGT